MGKIVVLDELTANKIAAGEVVERPASIVKELVENAIDAGSTRIEVAITDGGMAELTVTDNGSGMDRDDARLAFERHATSKIREAADLDSILSLGFRGEALPSIAAVSRLNLKTRVKDSVSGVIVTVEGGRMQPITETGCQAGTAIRVSDLFFNTPARQKHLKGPTTEAGQVSDVLNKFAMGYPEISFQLTVNGRLTLKSPGKGDLLDTIACVYGTNYARELLPVAANTADGALSGYLGRPSLSRAGRSRQIIFINGRFVRSSMISEAVEKAYHSMMMIGRHPVFVINLTINPGDVDVNVHPAKTEVRLSQAQHWGDMITAAAAETLSRNRLIPRVSLGGETKPVPEPRSEPGSGPGPGSEAEPDLRLRPASEPKLASGPDSELQPFHEHELQPAVKPLPESDTEPAPASAPAPAHAPASASNPVQMPEAKPEQQAWAMSALPYTAAGQAWQEPAESVYTVSHAMLRDNEKSSSGQFPELRPIGQIDCTYIVAQGLDGMYLIDQHAAHERILYEKFMDRPDEAVTGTQLLFPSSLQLTYQESQILNDHIINFTDLGFIIEHFGGETFLLRAVPSGAAKNGGEEIFLDLLDYFSRNRHTISGKALRERVIITMACKSAIKANHKLGLPEMESLLCQLAAARQPYTCPHGRPTLIHFSGYELEKKFKRVV
ncbi:MAG: DNA mismatch repair endonuclease MutL [Thermincola sp.]|nr:DNA mismatch repair endonuclease MutL [Thermincola sp.]MDT3704659.1 DNA mismatch repair endonuclease MutL [Thermincola sp.]